MNLEPKRILIAEDHYVSRHLLERNLSNWGFQVQAAEDGEAALRILEGENPPSLVLIDWMMPKMDGLEVCRRVRARVGQPFTYLLLLTAKNHKEELATALEAGVDEYVIKPFEPDELRARLNVARRVVALERRLALRENELRQAEAELAKLGAK
jgi:DNA-binding response OmpR family regulator